MKTFTNKEVKQLATELQTALASLSTVEQSEILTILLCLNSDQSIVPISSPAASAAFSFLKEKCGIKYFS